MFSFCDCDWPFTAAVSRRILFWPFLSTCASVVSHPKASAAHHGYSQYQTKAWIQCFVYAAHGPVVYCLPLVVHNSVFPQALTRGQDNTSVEISEGERLGGMRRGGSFPPLEGLDLYAGAAAG